MITPVRGTCPDCGTENKLTMPTAMLLLLPFDWRSVRVCQHCGRTVSMQLVRDGASGPTS